MRISRKQMWMGMAELAAQRSTCFRGNVGCIMVYENVPISIGYNGPESGSPHCAGNDCELANGGCTRAIHAEDNAIRRVPDRFTASPYYHTVDLYCTNMPCPGCAALIIDCGFVGRVYYRAPYRITSGIQDMINASIQVYRFTPAGYLIEEETGKVLEAN